jgi:hypothetical protein
MSIRRLGMLAMMAIGFATIPVGAGQSALTPMQIAKINSKSTA